MKFLRSINGEAIRLDTVEEFRIIDDKIDSIWSVNAYRGLNADIHSALCVFVSDKRQDCVDFIKDLT